MIEGDIIELQRKVERLEHLVEWLRKKARIEEQPCTYCEGTKTVRVDWKHIDCPACGGTGDAK